MEFLVCIEIVVEHANSQDIFTISSPEIVYCSPHSRSWPSTDGWGEIVTGFTIGCCVAFKGRIRFVPRSFHFSPWIAFAIISRCSLWFFLCYFSRCSHSRWKLPSHDNPARGKYLISNIFHRHQNRMNGSRNDLEPNISRETAWSKNNSAQVVEALTLGWWLWKNHFTSLPFSFLICIWK